MPRNLPPRTELGGQSGHPEVLCPYIWAAKVTRGRETRFSAKWEDSRLKERIGHPQRQTVTHRPGRAI